MTDLLTVSTATPTREAALKLAKSAIEGGLAAGGQVAGPVASTFWHEGKFGTGEEWAVSLKTTATRYKELEAHLIASHEWANPEVTAVPISHASAAYAGWVERTTAQQVSNSG